MKNILLLGVILCVLLVGCVGSSGITGSAVLEIPDENSTEDASSYTFSSVSGGCLKSCPKESGA